MIIARNAVIGFHIALTRQIPANMAGCADVTVALEENK
jgi:hypothetical protein